MALCGIKVNSRDATIFWSDRLKVLFYGENPALETGLAQVAKRHIETFEELEWEVETVCINDLENDGSDPYNIHIMKESILYSEYDIIFFSSDCQHIAQFNEEVQYMRGQKQFKTICYTPIDCNIINPETFSGVVLTDIAVTATYHAQSVFKRYIPNKHVDVIYHGCEPETFYPIDQEERREWRKKLFNIDDNTFLTLFVGRNQQRKDFARGMYAFHLFHGKCNDSICYMHSKQNDVGGSLPFYAKMFGMKYGTGKGDEIFFTPPDFNEATGISRTDLNIVYNIADLYTSSSTGEGWGLCTTEAMSARCPVLVPHNTSNIEIIGKYEERGHFILCGGSDLWIMPYGFTSNPRDIVSVTDMTCMLENIYHHREQAKEKAFTAREWTKQHTWQHFKDKWKEVLLSLETSMILS